MVVSRDGQTDVKIDKLASQSNMNIISFSSEITERNLSIHEKVCPSVSSYGMSEENSGCQKQALAIQGLTARFDSRFNSALNLKIRFNSILQKIEVDFFQFDSWLQLFEISFNYLKWHVEKSSFCL